MHRFLVVIEKSGKNYSAYSPDLPGCRATGKTREETAKADAMFAIEMHIRGLREDGIPVPKSHSSATVVAIQAD